MRELRDSQNRLALIMDSSQDAIMGKNLDGIITSVEQGIRLLERPFTRSTLAEDH